MLYNFTNKIVTLETNLILYPNIHLNFINVFLLIRLHWRINVCKLRIFRNESKLFMFYFIAGTKNINKNNVLHRNVYGFYFIFINGREHNQSRFGPRWHFSIVISTPIFKLWLGDKSRFGCPLRTTEVITRGDEFIGFVVGSNLTITAT